MRTFYCLLLAFIVACGNMTPSGDITAVNTPAGGGIVGGVTAGAASLTIAPCTVVGQVHTWDGTGWSTCTTPTAYTAGSGLSLTSTTFALNINAGVAQSCSAGTVPSGLSALGIVTCTAIGTQGGTTGTGTATDLAVWSTTTGLGNFAGSSPAACAAGQALTRVISAATGAITLTCSANVSAVSSGTGISASTTTGTTTVALNINAGVTQTCGAGTVATAITATGIVTCTAIGTAGGTTGTGTTNTIPKWTSASGLGNSTITDGGTGTVTTSSQFSISRVAGSAPLLDFSQVGQTDWQLYEHGTANTFALWNSTVAGDITAWDSAGNMTQGLNLSVLGSTILGDTAADSTLVNGTLHEIQTSGSAGLVFGTPTKDWTWYMSGTTAALHEYTGTLGGGGGTDWLTIAAGGATTLNGLTTIQNSGTSTTIVPLALTRTDVATVGDVTELDIGQQTAQAKIYTSTTNAGDLSATLNMSVRWFNGTDYNNSDFSMGAGGETFSATNPGGPDELDVRNRSNVASTTTRIATGDGTGYLFSILSDNAGSTTKLMATDRNTAIEIWTGAGGGAKAIGIDGSQNVTVTNLATTAGNVDVWGTNWHSILNWTGSTNQDTYIRAGVTAGNVWIGDVNTGGVGIGAAGNTTTVYGPLTSTAGANTFGETEYSMQTASNSSGTLTDVSFNRNRGVWWTWSGAGILDGMGFASGTPTDGQRYRICVLGAGSLTINNENASEPTATRRFHFIPAVPIIIRGGTCREFEYEDAGGVGSKRWYTEAMATMSNSTPVNNVIPKGNNGTTELTPGSITDTGTALSTSSSLTITNDYISITGLGNGTSSFGAADAKTAQTIGTQVGSFNTTGGTYNTTAGALQSTALNVSSTATRSAGANNLTNLALLVSASGGQVNTALETDAGDVKFNVTSGTFEVGGTASFDSTVNITGALTTNAVNINGGASVAGGLTSTTSESFNNSTFNGNLSTTTGTHVIDKDGASRPTIANCGTTAPTVVGNDVSGFFVTATGITSSCAITFHQAYGSNVDCNSWITGAGTTVAHPNLTIATTGLTFAGSSGPLSTGLKVHYECKDH